MSKSSSGLEPQIGGHGTPSESDRADADQCFEQALDLIRRQRWDAARDSLMDTLELVHDYPQAAGLLALIRDIQNAIMRGEDERPQIEAMRAYIYAFQNAPRAITPPPAPRTAAPAAASTPIVLPWADSPPARIRDLPPVTDVVAPVSAPPYVPEGGASGTTVWTEGRPLPSLSAFNPLDQLRVLWWFFIRPLRVKAYIRFGQAGEIEGVLGWLAGTLLWLPLALPVIGMAVGTLPSSQIVTLALFAVIMPMWVIGGWLMSHRSGTTALMLASAVWVIFSVIFMYFAGNRAGALIAGLFLLLAGFPAGINGIGAERASAHLALGATFVTTVAAIYKMYTFISPIVWEYVSGFVLANTGGPILILMAVFIAGLLALGVTYVIPLIATYFVSFAVEAVIEENLGSGANPLGAFALMIMLGLYGILGWVCFGGGWQIIEVL